MLYILSILFVIVLAGVFGALGAAFAQEQQDATQADVPTLLGNGDFAMARNNCALAQFYYQEVLKSDPQNVAALIGNVTGKLPSVTPEMATLASATLFCSSDKAVGALSYRAVPFRAMVTESHRWLTESGILR